MKSEKSNDNSFHGSPDIHSETGGESLIFRGAGLDNCPCFVCKTRKRLNKIIVFSVKDKAVGKQVIAMFKCGAQLDCESETGLVQVEIGICNNHLENIDHLVELIEQAGSVITREMVNEAINLKKQKDHE